jgi:tRNA dimethylallyltransferase
MALPYHVLTGPTAAGKTDLLLSRAVNRPLTAISADSRQVYLYMDIGTGKPTLTAQKILPHYVIDCVEPTAIYSVHQFLIDAARALAAAHQDGRAPWVVGGSGLYIRALVEGLELGCPPRPELRRALAAKLRELTPRQLAAELDLELRDPDNPVRVVRAAELACRRPARARAIYAWAGLESGRQPANGENAELSAARAELGRWRCAGLAALDPGREALEHNIVRRTREMFRHGLLAEVAQLRARGFGRAGVVQHGIGYREAGQLLDGELAEEEAIERTIIRTRQYAKRQRTYIRGRNWPVRTPRDIEQWLDAVAAG